MHKHLGQVAAVRLILRLSKNDLNSADDRSRFVFSSEHHSFAARRAGGDAAPEFLRFSAGHWKHEADGCTAFHAVDQHIAQLLDFAITNRLQTPNPNAVPHLSSPRCTRTLACDDHNVSSGFARAIAKRGWLVELHGEAIVFRKTIRNTAERYFDTPLLHPDLLIDIHVASSGFVSHSCAGRQNDLDNLNG